MDIELLQFRYSPYNEKARWALDIKRLPHVRRSLLPGPHMGQVKKLTGQTATPVLKLDGRWIAGSAAILAALEGRGAVPSLLPVAADMRERALAIEKRFDEDWGPRIRRATLDALLGDLGYFRDVFADGQPPLRRLIYRAVLPLAKGMVRKGNGIDRPGAVADGNLALDEALDFVAREAGASGHLAGGALSVADIAAASMLAMAVDPPNSPMTRPRPMAAGFAAWVARRQDHPGAAWVRRLYADHRGARRDGDGAIRYD